MQKKWKIIQYKLYNTMENVGKFIWASSRSLKEKVHMTSLECRRNVYIVYTAEVVLIKIQTQKGFTFFKEELRFIWELYTFLTTSIVKQLSQRFLY